MNLLNAVVIHKTFGRGNLVTQTASHVTVRFDAGDKTFQYPAAFGSFLSLEDAGLSAAVQADIQARADAEAAKAAEEKARRARLIAPPPPPPPSPPAAPAVRGKPAARSQRAPRPTRASRPARAVAQRADVHKHIVFKCNYNNGGKNTQRIGYHGVCSDKVIEYNILKARRAWCTRPECLCSQYLEGDIARDELDNRMQNGDFVCYESQMLRDWRAMAGVNHTGEKRAEPRRMLDMERNSLAVLTTRFPHTGENERVIFAVFLVDESHIGGADGQEGYVASHSEYRLSLSPNESRKILYWTYHANATSADQCKWGSGLYRHLSDQQGAQILRDIVEIKAGTPDEDLARRFFDHFCTIHGIVAAEIPKPAGALTLQPW